LRPNGMKLSRRHLSWSYTAFAMLYLSGILWIFLHYGVRYQNEIGKSVHPLEPWSLKIHGAAAMFTLIILGTLIPIHMKKGWKAKRNRQNGVFLISINLLLMLTGYSLYYAGGERLRSVSYWAHIIIGVLFPAILAGHIIGGRKTREKHSKYPHKSKRMSSSAPPSI